METRLRGRVIAVVAALSLAALSPWWLTLLFLLACFFWFNTFYEGIAVGFILDLFYGPPPGFSRFFLLCTATMALLAFLAPLLKRRIIFYRPRRF